MADHSRALVPLETWTFASPDLKARGQDVDLGLLAEALVYYDQVYVSAATQKNLAALVQWFAEEGKLPTLFGMLDEGVIRLVDFSFITTGILQGSEYALWNIQDPLQAQPNTFALRYLYNEEIANALPKSRDRERLFKACQGKVVELKAKDFEHGVENARSDLLDPTRSALVIQSLVDEAFRIAEMGPPPTVEATIAPGPGDGRHSITWNINLEEVTNAIGPKLGFHLGQPLAAVASCNRLIWAAAGLHSDLYLSRPISRLVGTKLHESSLRLDATRDLITELQGEVEFPDVRALVNARQLNLETVLTIRKHGAKFRRWLQSEVERDRNALIAYHHEVAKESGFTRSMRRGLALFGVLGGGALGGAAGEAIGSPSMGGVVGAGTAGLAFLIDVASKLGADWRPVVFGNWLRDEVARRK